MKISKLIQAAEGPEPRWSQLNTLAYSVQKSFLPQLLHFIKTQEPVKTSMLVIQILSRVAYMLKLTGHATESNQISTIGLRLQDQLTTENPDLDFRLRA